MNSFRILVLSVCAVALAAGQSGGVSYDVRVFRLTGTSAHKDIGRISDLVIPDGLHHVDANGDGVLENVPIYGSANENGVSRNVVIDNGPAGNTYAGAFPVASLGTLTDAGLQLFDSHAVLALDPVLESTLPDSVETVRLASQDGVPDGSTIDIDLGDPLQYIATDGEKHFVLRETEERPGLIISVRYAGNAQTRVSLTDRYSLERERLDCVMLNVGKPKLNQKPETILATPSDTWQDCYVYGNAEQQYLVFVRMHATPEALAAAAAQFPREKFSVDLKFISAPKKISEKLESIVASEPMIHLIDGFAQVVEKIEVPGKVIILDDPVRALELVRSIKGASLVSAPRVTVFSERSSKKRNEHDGSAPSIASPASDAFLAQFDGCPIIKGFLNPLRCNIAVICDIASYPANKPDRPSANPGNTKYPAPPVYAPGEWYGVVAGVSIDPGPRPNTASLDLAVVVRERVDVGRSHDTGFRIQLDAPIGKSTWLTTKNDRTGEQMMIQLTVEQIPFDSPNQVSGAGGGVGGFIP